MGKVWEFVAIWGTRGEAYAYSYIELLLSKTEVKEEKKDGSN